MYFGETLNVSLIIKNMILRIVQMFNLVIARRQSCPTVSIVLKTKHNNNLVTSMKNSKGQIVYIKKSFGIVVVNR